MIAEFGCLYEGKGEAEALPSLVRRLFLARRPDLVPVHRHGSRVERSKLRKPGYLERSIEVVCRLVAPTALIVILFDSEDDEPDPLLSDLRARIARVRPDRNIVVALAVKKYENWLLAGADPIDLTNADHVGRSKARIRSDLLQGSHYRETVDQAALTRSMDLALARRRSPSFAQFALEIENWIDSLPRQHG